MRQKRREKETKNPDGTNGKQQEVHFDPATSITLNVNDLSISVKRLRNCEIG